MIYTFSRRTLAEGWRAKNALQANENAVNGVIENLRRPRDIYQAPVRVGRFRSSSFGRLT
jgi:hypothetical protein